MTHAMRAVGRAKPGEAERSALRVAIARAGRIEREWVLESGRVSAGGTDDADVFLGPHAGPATTLLRIDDGEMTLIVPAHASGRVQLEAGPRELAPLAGTSIALDPSARGRVVLPGGAEGAVSVLFQRVAAPVKRARPELPQAVRGGLLDRVDWLFTAVAAASFMLHLGLIVGLSGADWPVPPSLAAVTDREAMIYFAEATPPPEPTIDDPSQPTDPTQPSDPTTPSHDPSPSHDPVAHATHTVTHVADPDPTIVAATALARVDQLLIGSEGIHGAVQDLLDHGQPTDDAASVLAAAGTVLPGTTTARLDPRDHTTGLPGTDFDPRIATGPVGPLDHGTPIVERAPHHPHVAWQPIEDPIDPVVFNDAMLRAALRARMPVIQRCYETELTRTPGLSGRITVSMQVERAGVLSHVETEDDTVGSRGLSECVINNVRSIRLANGPSEPLTVSYPIVFAPQS